MINPLYPNCIVWPVNLKRWSGKFAATPETTAMGLTGLTHARQARGSQEGKNAFPSHTDIGAQFNLRSMNFQRRQKWQESLKKHFHKYFLLPK